MIRKVIESDAKRIAEIHCYGWRVAYKDIISEKFLYSKLSVYDRVNQFYKRKEHESPFLYVFEEDEIIRGFIKIGPCRDTDKNNAFEIWGIYVEPQMQGRGIGTELLKFCEQAASEQKYKDIVLWVLSENTKARSFYEKNGYVSDGKTEYMENIDAVEIRYVKHLE